MVIVIGTRTETFNNQNKNFVPKLPISTSSCYICDKPVVANMLMNDWFKQIMSKCAEKSTNFPVEIKSLNFFRPNSTSIVIMYEKFVKEGVVSVNYTFNTITSENPDVITIENYKEIFFGKNVEQSEDDV